MTYATGDAIMYATLLFLLSALNLLVFYIIFSLSLQNYRNENQEVMGINLNKYLKISLIGISYGMILITLNLMVAVSTNLTDLTQFLGLIGFLFTSMLSLAWVWTIIIIIWIVFNIINDFKIHRELLKLADEAVNRI